MRRIGLAALVLTVARMAAGAAPGDVQIAAPPWRTVPAEELAMTAEPRAPGAPAVYLYTQVDQQPARKLEWFYRQVKVLGEEGRSRANITIRYRSQLDTVEGLEARVVQPDGTIVPFEGTVYDQAIYSTEAGGLHTKSIALPDVRVGSIIEYRYSMAHSDWSVAAFGWVLSQDLFTRHARYSNRPVSGMQLRLFAPRGWPPGSSRPGLADDGAARMEVRNMPAFVSEEFMPPLSSLVYSVDFLYSPPQQDPASFWSDFVKSKNEYFDFALKEPRLYSKPAAKLVQKEDTDEQKARKIYAHVQQLQNTAYEGPLDPKEAKRRQSRLFDQLLDFSDVGKRGYGNSQELAMYCVALLRSAGIVADPVLVGGRGERFFEREANRAEDLNGILVRAMIDGREVLLDPTIPYLPFGSLAWFHTAVDAIKVDMNGGRWFETPPPRSADATLRREAHLRLSEDGVLAGEVTATYTGHLALNLRMMLHEADTTERKQYLEDELKTFLTNSAQVKLLEQPDWKGIGTPLQVKYELTVPDWVVSSGSRMFVGFGLFGAREKGVFVSDKRQHPIYFGFPYEYEDELRIAYPQGYRLESAPPPTPPSAEPLLTYAARVEDENGALVLRRQLVAGVLTASASNYSRFRDFFQTVRGGDEQQVILAR